MWRNPAYYPQADQAAQQTPPVDNGQRLATFERRGKDGPEEIRVGLHEWQGHTTLRCHKWMQTQAGDWIPTKACISFRPAELGELLASVRSAMETLDTHQPEYESQEPAGAPGSPVAQSPASGRPFTPDVAHRPASKPHRPPFEPTPRDDRPRHVERRGRPEPRELDEESRRSLLERPGRPVEDHSAY
jgi:hypothetical protein